MTKEPVQTGDQGTGASAALKKPSLGLLNLGLKPKPRTTSPNPAAGAAGSHDSTATSPSGASGAPESAKPRVVVTRSAAAAILDQLSRRPNNTPRSGLRIGVKAGGCSGLSYIVQFEDAPRPEDEIIEVDGAKVYVDPKSLAFLAGTEFDYVKTLMKQGFEFRNPQQKSSCGCGESFTV